jgi:hypothetical protein
LFIDSKYLFSTNQGFVSSFLFAVEAVATV